MLDDGGYSPFKSPKSILDPNAFQMHSPSRQASSNSPKRLPISKSLKTISSVEKTNYALTNISGSHSLYSTPQKSHPLLSEADQSYNIKGHNAFRTPIERYAASVADMRRSFEQVPGQPGAGDHTVAPRMPTESIFASRSQLIRGNTSRMEDAGLEDELVKPSFSRASAISNVAADFAGASKTIGNSLHSSKSEHLPHKGPEPNPVRRTPTFLPRSNSSRSRVALMMKSRTFDAPISPNSKPNDPLAATWNSGGPVPTRGDLDKEWKGFPHSSPIHPLLLCGSGAGSECEESSPGWPREKPHPASVNTLTSSRRSKDFGTQTDLSFPSEVCVSPKNHTEPVHRSSKVADLRRLFDRSSPRSFISFTRRQRHTLPDIETKCPSPRQDELSAPSMSLVSTPTSQKTATPPALTTEISVNDFTCTFVDGQGQLESLPSSHTRKELEQFVADTPPPAAHESPLKDRINHFEHLHSRSQSDDTGLKTVPLAASLVSKKDIPISAAPNATENRRTVRNVWRRISQSLTQSFDGSHSQEHYHSSYQESSTSMDYGRTPPYHTIFPLLPARKSVPFMHRFSSSGTNNHIFSLDGANQSIPHVPDADVFSNAGNGARSSKREGNSNEFTRATSHESGASHQVSLPPPDEIRKRGAQQNRERRKQEKKLEKQRKREERKRRIAQRKQEGYKSAERAASNAAESAKAKESKWGKQTDSGFMVREARLSSGDLVAPRPNRPGQVKNIVNFYKEKSSSFLRVASGGYYGGSKDQIDEASGVNEKTQKNRKGKGKETLSPSRVQD
ncbi:hypothetical protein SCARD494_07500 [Seiridium cardinale]